MRELSPMSLRRPISAILLATVIVLSSVAALPEAVGAAAAPAASASPAAPSTDLGHPLAAGHPQAGPPGALGSLRITLYNPGANATGTYDQPVGVNSSRYANLINSNWSNAIVEYTDNSTPVYGWLESGNSNQSTETLLWLRLASIPGHGWTNVSVYFGPTAWFNLSESGYLGENPSLSTPYASLDNGWRVFDDYANFSGTRLPVGWTPLGNWAGTVDNGLTVAASYETGAIEDALAQPYASNVTVETSAWLSASGDPLYLLLAQTPGYSSEFQFFPSAYAFAPGLSGSSEAALETSNASGAGIFREGSVTAPVDFSQAPHILGLSWRHSNSSETASTNYVPILSQVDATVDPIADLGLGTYCSGNCSSWNLSWVRARSAPDPMPVVSGQAFTPFGVVASGSPLVTDTNHAVSFVCNASAEAINPTYLWAFGDGQSASGRSALHSYARPGRFVAVCSVAGSGAAANSSAAVRINPPPTILLFQAVPPRLTLGATLNLIANLSGGTGPFTYSYVGLPPGCPARDAPTLSCLPGETGTFAIEVVVRDAANEETSASITLTVTPPTTPSNGTALSPTEGYALAGAVAGMVVLAGVLPVMLWNRRRPPDRPPPRDVEPAEPEAEATDRP
jgi:hypothetical protein